MLLKALRTEVVLSKNKPILGRAAESIGYLRFQAILVADEKIRIYSHSHRYYHHNNLLVRILPVGAPRSCQATPKCAAHHASFTSTFVWRVVFGAGTYYAHIAAHVSCTHERQRKSFI